MADFPIYGDVASGGFLAGVFDVGYYGVVELAVAVGISPDFGCFTLEVEDVFDGWLAGTGLTDVSTTFIVAWGAHEDGCVITW